MTSLEATRKGRLTTPVQEPAPASHNPQRMTGQETRALISAGEPCPEVWSREKMDRAIKKQVWHGSRVKELVGWSCLHKLCKHLASHTLSLILSEIASEATGPVALRSGVISLPLLGRKFVYQTLVSPWPYVETGYLKRPLY